MADQTGMQPVAPQTAPAVPVVNQVKQLLSQDKIKEKFGEVLGQKAPQFMASITNTVSGSAQLKKCPANSIIGAAFVAATYDLPIDSNLGFAAIVPYNESVWNPRKKDWEKVPKAQFQMMYKGFIQLAIRSGYYERMNYAVVYKDELESYNPITGEIKFVEDFSNCKQRDAGDESKFSGTYTGSGRGYFYCENPEAKKLPREAFGNQMPEFVGFGTPEYNTKLTTKTSPRWCPRRKKRE